MAARHQESFTLLQSLSEADLSRPVYSFEGGQWTVREVVAHLADSERGQVGQIQRLVKGEQTIPPDFDLARWNKRSVEKRAGQTLADQVAEIEAAYQKGLALLDTLSEADLDRRGRHPRGDEPSVEEFFRHLAEHRAGHAADIRASLERQP
jgi:hypothetical protein